jgi:hypothetical protein
MNRMHKVKEEGETITGATKSNIQEKKGAEHLTTHHLDSFQEQITIGRKKELSQSIEKSGHTIGSHVFQDDSLQYGCLTSSNHQTTPSTTVASQVQTIKPLQV